jgi:signal transduction histidine kinase
MARTMHILLVENNSTDQVAIQRLFQSQNLGYMLEIAESQAQALKCMKVFSYDLILLDHQLDDGTGLELLEHIIDTPVIFIAGRSSEELIIKAMKAGAYDFLVKDPHMDYLSLLPSTIDQVMSRKRMKDKRSCYITELEQSNVELKNFAFMASHDMKEPLRKIVGFGDLLLEKSKDMSQESQGYAEKMQNSAKRMQAMIEDLLQFSTVATKGEPFRPIDLNVVVQEVLEDLEDSISETNGVVCAEDLPTLEADPIQMHQLFQNLISNALKFHKKEQTPKIELVAKPVRKDSWDINISDNGIGLDADQREKIFQPFVRLHGRSAFAGSGIGLAICERIVARHNGKIKVGCSGEMGSTFQVTLPMKQDS